MVIESVLVKSPPKYTKKPGRGQRIRA